MPTEDNLGFRVMVAPSAPVLTEILNSSSTKPAELVALQQVLSDRFADAEPIAS